MQQSDEVFHMRCLSRAAHRDVTHRDDRHIKAPALQYTDIKERVTQVHCPAIEAAQWEHPIVDFDEVAFHIVGVLLHPYAEGQGSLQAVTFLCCAHHHPFVIVTTKEFLYLTVEVVVLLLLVEELF